MSSRRLLLPADVAPALTLLQQTSHEHPVIVFKRSPVCPISHHAEDQFRDWLAAAPELLLAWAEIDVIAERMLARGLTAELAIAHESPQALLFAAGDLHWHDSHDRLTVARFGSAIAGAHDKLDDTRA